MLTFVSKFGPFPFLDVFVCLFFPSFAGVEGRGGDRQCVGKILSHKLSAHILSNSQQVSEYK
jgi:hypothetical protein